MLTVNPTNSTFTPTPALQIHVIPTGIDMVFALP
jgi:hypothetical protein